MNLRTLLPAALLALSAFALAAQPPPSQPRPSAQTQPAPQQTWKRNFANTNPNVAQIPEIPGIGPGNGRPNFGGCDAADVTMGINGCGGGAIPPWPDPQPGVCQDQSASNPGQPGDCLYTICEDPFSTTYHMIGDCGPCLLGYEKNAQGVCGPFPPIYDPGPGINPSGLNLGLTSAMWSKRSGSGPTSSHGYRKREERFTTGDGMFWHYGRKKTYFKIAWSVGSVIGTYAQEDLNQVRRFPGPPAPRCPDGAIPHVYQWMTLCFLDGVPVPSIPGDPDPMYTFFQEHTFQWTGDCVGTGPICVRQFLENHIDRTATLTVTHRATGQVVLQKGLTVKRYGSPRGGGGGGGRPTPRPPQDIM